MINIPLLKRSFKSTRVLWFALTFAMAVMLAQFIFLSAGSGMGGMGGALVSMMFYNMTAIVLSGIYAMVSANKLVALQVDRGSMAYVLSNPIKRSTIALTQMFLLVANVIGSYLITTIVHVISAAALDTGETVAQIIGLNLGACLTTLVIAGVCYLASCMFNLSKNSLGLGGGITAFSFICYFISTMSATGIEGMQYFKYLTFISLYDVTSILSNGDDWIWKLCILAGIALVSFASGAVVFTRKDLPL
jgi:ABC-2 type transport system permease protein